MAKMDDESQSDKVNMRPVITQSHYQKLLKRNMMLQENVKELMVENEELRKRAKK